MKVILMKDIKEIFVIRIDAILTRYDVKKFLVSIEIFLNALVLLEPIT